MMNIKQAVAFSILMQNNNGILYKAPWYVMEKLQYCEWEKNPERLLDPTNEKIFNEYMKLWKLQE